MKLSDSFTSSARRYDVMTGLNPGYRRELRRAARALSAQVQSGGDDGPLIWDLGCGTGLSTAALQEQLPQARLLGVDASEGMLGLAQAKTWRPGTRFVLERAENLEHSLHEELGAAPDGVFAAYLLRNVDEQDRTAVLATIRRRMAPGTPLVLHDYSVVESRGAQLTWTLVCFGVIIPLSVVMRAEPSLFTYLWRSVMNNDSTRTVLQRLRDAGFEGGRVFTARGWHRKILHTYTAVAGASRGEQ